jgi:hypothetical protein
MNHDMRMAFVIEFIPQNATAACSFLYTLFSASPFTLTDWQRHSTSYPQKSEESRDLVPLPSMSNCFPSNKIRTPKKKAERHHRNTSQWPVCKSYKQHQPVFCHLRVSLGSSLWKAGQSSSFLEWDVPSISVGV